MGLRFQRRVSLFPGVRLNFSKSGISTTIGVRGARLTLGPRGTYLNTGLPGTGISYRTRLDAPSRLTPRSQPALSEAAHYGEENEVASAPTRTLTTVGLDEFKTLIVEASKRRATLHDELLRAKRRERRAALSLWLARLFVVRLATQSYVPDLAKRAFDARKVREAKEDELACCVVDVDFGLSQSAANKYDLMTQAFESLTRCERIWDVTSFASIDRFHARTSAHIAVDRKPVAFCLKGIEVLRSSKPSFWLKNANGADLFIFPAFTVLWNSVHDFALIDVRELNVAYSQTRFTEESAVPRDAEQIGTTWKKANKDGSRDRRFNDNYQIPIMKYGTLDLRTAAGVNEEYLISNFAAGAKFARAWADYQNELANAQPQQSDSVDTEPDQDTSSEKPPEESFVAPRLPKTLLYDWIALPFVIASLICTCYFAVIETPVILRSIQEPSASSEPVSVEQKSPALPHRFVVIARPAVNLRAQPSSSSQIVGRATQGDQLEVFGEVGRWLQVGNGQPVGWLRKDLARSTD